MAEIVAAHHTAESGHFYRRDGTPAYTIIGKNGKERNTTLADARKLDLWPSVTTICGEANAPALTNWKIDQGVLAALTLPKENSEAEADWLKRVKADAKETARKAAERGTQIHAWVQQYFEGETLPDEQAIYGLVVKETLAKEGLDGPWLVEQSFARDGFGGKVDLHRLTEKIGPGLIWNSVVLDIKTSDKPLEKTALYDNHFMQLAAYRHGLNLPDAGCGIVFVSTVEVAVKVIQAEETDLQRGLHMFLALKQYWYAKTGLVVG